MIENLRGGSCGGSVGILLSTFGGGATSLDPPQEQKTIVVIVNRVKIVFIINPSGNVDLQYNGNFAKKQVEFKNATRSFARMRNFISSFAHEEMLRYRSE